MLGRIGDAGDQSASAHGNHDGVNVVQVVQYFKGDRPLSGNHIFIVKRMDEGVSLLFFQLQCFLVSVIVAALHKTYLCAEAFGGLHLGDGCAIGQTNDGFDPVVPPGGAAPRARRGRARRGSLRRLSG